MGKDEQSFETDPSKALEKYEKATPGPWKWGTGFGIHFQCLRSSSTGDGVAMHNCDWAMSDADKALIEESREALPYWIRLNVAQAFQIKRQDTIINMGNTLIHDLALATACLINRVTGIHYGYEEVDPNYDHRDDSEWKEVQALMKRVKEWEQEGV